MRGLSLNAWLVLCGCATLLRMGITAGAASVLALVVAAQLLHALSFAAHHAACIGLVSQHFPGRLRGRGQALFTVIGYGLPGVLGGLLGGLLSAVEMCNNNGTCRKFDANVMCPSYRATRDEALVAIGSLIP